MNRRGTLAALLLCLPLSAAATADDNVRLQPSRIESIRGIQIAADFNGDGLDDIFTRDQIQYNLGGRFGPRIGLDGIPASNPDHQDVGVGGGGGDFNGDGFADLFVIHENVSDSLLLGSGSGTFTAKGIPKLDGYGRNFVDFTGDGIADVITWKPGQILLYRNNGDATFTLHQTLPWEVQWYQPSLPTGDLNGDGRLDLVLRTDDSLVLLIAQAGGQFEKQERFTRFGPSYPEIGDLNGDGKADIAYVSPSQDAGAVSVLYGDGTGRFPGYSRLLITSSLHDNEGSAHDLAIADFVPGGAQELAYGTGDGDVVILSGATGQLREVSRARVEGTYIGVRAMRFRSAAPELLAMGFVNTRDNEYYYTWVVTADGEITPPSRVRGRAINRITAAAAGPMYRLDVQSDCPIPGFDSLNIEREGLFAFVGKSGAVESGRGANLPGELYLELQVKDGPNTRVLTGTLVPTADGLTGKLFEWKPSPCGRWEAHKVTAVPLR